MSRSSNAPPLFSIRSDKGRRKKMEDSHDIQLNFMELPLDPTGMKDVIPARLQTSALPKAHSTGSNDELELRSSSRKSHFEEIGWGKMEEFHLFSVFDGHGGDRAALHCANKLAQNLKTTINRTLKKHALPIQEIVRHKTVPTHVLLAEAINLAEMTSSDFEEDVDEADRQSADTAPEEAPQTPLLQSNYIERIDERECLENGGLFSTMSLGVPERCAYTNDTRSLHTLVSGPFDSIDSRLNGLTAAQLVSCFNDAFVLTDNQFDCDGGAEESGSTALTALVSSRLLCFAHCGDCRGVLYRDGHVVQVTREHSPECDIEKNRIEMLGGRIIALRSDTPRVMGVLNMTRAIGDFGLKPFIIPNPEVTILHRSELDEFVVLASDGLWTALTNQDVCDLVLKCFERVEEKGMSRHNASKVATNVLISKAIDSGSPDNITVIVIDLRQFC